MGDCLTFPVNPLDTWNASGPQENVFGNQFSTFDSSHNHYQGIHHSETPSVTESISGRLVARDEDRNKGTIPMPTFASRPSTMSSFFQWIFRKTLWLDSKDSRYRNCNLTNSQHLLQFLCWKRRFKNQVTTCCDCPSEAMLWIKEVETVDSLEEF